MANTEGIIFSDIFITNKEIFVNFFSKFYQENQSIIDPIIAKLNDILDRFKYKTLTESMALEFKVAWKEFENKVLLNQQDLQLIVAYRGAKGGKDGYFSEIINQNQVEETSITEYGKRYGINAGNDLIRQSMEALKASQIEKFLQLHLNGLLDQLEEKVNIQQAYILHQFHTKQLNSLYQEVPELHLTGLPWRTIFYGPMEGAKGKNYYFSGQGLGKAYDAFMNHMANKESNIFNYLKSGGLQQESNSIVLNKRKTTVYQEENGIGPQGHFPQLLKDSTNHTGWYTGGDIIIVDKKTMSVVYNIQLKTTTANKPSVFGEKVQDIRKFLKNFNELTPQKKAENLFEFLKTSISNQSDFNSLPQKDIDNLLEQHLKKKIQIKLI